MNSFNKFHECLLCGRQWEKKDMISAFGELTVVEDDRNMKEAAKSTAVMVDGRLWRTLAVERG